jgi:hypothetical protein
MWVYWTTLAVIGGPLLLTSWERLAAVAAGAAMVKLLRVVTRPPRSRFGTSSLERL